MSLYDVISKRMEQEKQASAKRQSEPLPQKTLSIPQPKPTASMLAPVPENSMWDKIKNIYSTALNRTPQTANVGSPTQSPNLATGALIGLGKGLQTVDRLAQPIVQPIRDWSQTPTGQSVKAALTTGGLQAGLSLLPKTMVPPKVTENLEVFSKNAANSISMGALDYLMPKTQRDKFMDENYPVAKMAGTLGGYVVPGMAVEKGLMKTLPQLAPKVGESLLMRAGKRASVDALSGGITGGVEGAISEAGRPIGLTDLVTGNDKKDILGKAIEGAVQGFGLGGALGGIIGGVGSKLEANKIFKKGLSSVSDSIDNYKFPQLREPNILPLPDNMARGPKVSAEIPSQYRQPLPKSGDPLMLPAPSPYSQAKGMVEVAGDATRPIRGEKPKTLAPTVKPEIKVEPKTFEPPKDFLGLNKPKYSPEVQTKLDNLDAKYKQDVALQKKAPFADPDTQASKLKGMAMKNSAEKRKIIQGDSLIKVEGGLTDTELANEIKRLKSNYSGKELITPDGEGIATGQNSFGKVGVKVNGEVKYYKADEITPKVDIDAKINAQKQALNVPKNEPNIKSPSIKIEPVKTQNIANTKVEFANDINVGTKNQFPDVGNMVKPIDNLSTNKPNLSTKVEPDIVNVSKVKTNTLRNNIPELQTKEGQKFVDDFEATYGVKTDKGSIQRAKGMLESDYEGVYKKTINEGISSKEDNLAAFQILRDLRAAGDFDNAMKIVKKIQPQATNFGQIIQSFNTVGKDSLEGIAMRGQKLISSIEEDILKANPEVKKSIKDILSAVDKNLKLLPINLQLFAETVDKQLKQVMGKLYKKDYIESIMKIVNDGGVQPKKVKNAIDSGYASPIVSDETMEKIASAVKEKFGIPSFGGDDLKKMSKLYDQLDGLKPEDWEYRKTMYQINDVVKSKMPRDIADKFATYQFINLYGNTLTPIKIKFGNLTAVGKTYVKDVLRYAIDKAIPGKSVTQMPSIKTQLKGFKKGASETWKDYRNEVDTDPFIQSYDFDTEKGLTFKNKFMREAEKLVKFAMGIMERPYKQGIYDDELRMLMKSQKEPTEEMVQEAMEKAREKAQSVMFADRNIGTDTANSLRRGLNAITNTPINLAYKGVKKTLNKFDVGKNLPNELIKDTKRFGVGNLAQPIIKTPINMAKTAVEYSPIGPLFNMTSREKFVDSMAKAIIGSVFGIGSGYVGKKTGVISGGLPTDADARNFGEESGRQPYSLNLFGKSFDISYIQPLGMLMSFGAELASDNKKKQPFVAALDSLINQGMLQGFAKLLGQTTMKTGSPSENILDAVTSGASTMIPLGGLMNQISKTIDPFKRDTSSDSTLERNLINKTAQRTPARLFLPKKVTNTGEVAKEDSAFNIWLNPGKVKSLKTDSVTNELMRLYDESGESKQFPPKATPKISYKLTSNAKEKSKIAELTPQQLSEYQQKLGAKNLQAVQKTITSNEYKKAANDKEKAELISNAMSKAKQEVETEMLKSIGINEYKSSSGGRSLRGGRSGRSGR